MRLDGDPEQTLSHAKMFNHGMTHELTKKMTSAIIQCGNQVPSHTTACSRS
jgi:hypothetical protein